MRTARSSIAHGTKRPTRQPSSPSRRSPQWRHYLAVGGDRVFGRALLWGDRLEGELGWRAATAYPLALYVPATLADADAIAAGLEVYGVPVEIAGALAPVHESVAA